jgi:2-C-methyl-D-erythritol 2,4-cyclodiphosphate synthase
MPFRIGTGYDIHRLVEGRPLILGGVTIPYEKGLLGHSDGDVIVHAICDALLGALAMGDIGVLFPDTSDTTKDMYSIRMLEIILQKINSEYSVVNIDINCICEKPKLGNYRQEMINLISVVLNISKTQVSVKFRTNEGLGEIGSGNAIAAQAAVLLKKKE